MPEGRGCNSAYACTHGTRKSAIIYAVGALRPLVRPERERQDPYERLGIRRHAHDQEVRNAAQAAESDRGHVILPGLDSALALSTSESGFGGAGSGHRRSPEVRPADPSAGRTFLTNTVRPADSSAGRTFLTNTVRPADSSAGRTSS